MDHHLKKDLESKNTTKRVLAHQKNVVIYGVTDRSNLSLVGKFNDFLIDQSRISLKEKRILFHSLQLLTNSGVRFTRSLKMLANRTLNQRLKRILQTIEYDMEEQGMTFSKAMTKYPQIFTEYEIKMVQSGELTGKVKESLEAIANQIQKNLELETKVRSALLYPIIVICTAILAIIIILVVVVPKFTMLFDAFGAELPFFTKILISLSNFFIHLWWLIIIGLWVIWNLFKNWKKSDEGRKKWDQFVLDIPILKTIIRNIQTVRIATNFSILLKAGIPINKILITLQDIIPNIIIKDALLNISQKVQKGGKIFESFSDESCLDPVLAEVIEVGEKTGSISEVLEKLSEQYELEVDNQLKNITTLIEPIVIILVGAGVLFVAMAVMLPIFELQKVFVAH